MPIILGCDPGVTGAFAWLDTTTNRIISVMDHGAWAHAQDAAKELHLILGPLGKPTIVVIEAQHARALRNAEGKVVQGIASTWNYAEAYGTLLGCLAALMVPVHRADPAVWKGNMGLDRDKEKSLERARKLWPDSLDLFKRKKDHGRAEAALLAEYGRRFLPLPAAAKARVL